MWWCKSREWTELPIACLYPLNPTRSFPQSLVKDYRQKMYSAHHQLEGHIEFHLKKNGRSVVVRDTVIDFHGLLVFCVISLTDGPTIQTQVDLCSRLLLRSSGNMGPTRLKVHYTSGTLLPSKSWLLLLHNRNRGGKENVQEGSKGLPKVLLIAGDFQCKLDGP